MVRCRQTSRAGWRKYGCVLGELGRVTTAEAAGSQIRQWLRAIGTMPSAVTSKVTAAICAAGIGEAGGDGCNGSAVGGEDIVERTHAIGQAAPKAQTVADRKQLGRDPGGDLGLGHRTNAREVSNALAPMLRSAATASCRARAAAAAQRSCRRAGRRATRRRSRPYWAIAVATTASVGKPSARSLAATPEMARSAWANVSRRGSPSVKCARFAGSVSARACGRRTPARRKRSSRVSDAIRVFGLVEDHALPPRLRQKPNKRGRRGMGNSRPARHPLHRREIERNDVQARQQDRSSARVAATKSSRLRRGRQHRRNHGVDRLRFDAHVVAAALRIRGRRAPIEILFVAGRERLLPAILHHVEIETDAAALELGGVDHCARCASMPARLRLRA